MWALGVVSIHSLIAHAEPPPRRVRLTCFFAGNLSPEAGDRLVKNGVTLLNVISATE
jgi:hypothetical protein